MNKWRVTGLVALLLALPSCSCYVVLTATGLLQGSITVQLPERLRVESLSVDRQEGKGHWVRIWDARGSAKISSITYGSIPKGFKQPVAPEALRRNHIYRAEIHTPPTFFGPPCGGGVTFWISGDGQLKTCKSSACEKQLFNGQIPD